MHNYRICLFILFLYLLLFQGCNELNEQEEICDYPDNIVYDYNPEKARVDIVTRIDMPAGYFVNYTNGHFYLRSDNRVSIFDLSGDEIIPIEDVTFDISALFLGENDLTAGYGIMERENNIIFMIGEYFQDKLLISVDKNEKTACFSDLSADILRHIPKSDYNVTSQLECFYYDCLTDDIYAGYIYVIHPSGEAESCVCKYTYNQETNHYEEEDFVLKINKHYGFHNMYLTNQNLILGSYGCLPNGSVENMIRFYPNFEESSCHEVDLRYLLVWNKPLSVFYDEYDYWMYVCENGKYELLKLKLLE